MVSMSGSGDSEWETESGDKITSESESEEPEDSSRYASNDSEIFYPVLSLPIEITVMIFEAACIEPWTSISDYTEVIISHVCHSWRAIALSCPQLWSTFKHDGSVVERPVLRPQLSAYIERSQNRLLDLAFEADGGIDMFAVAQLYIVPSIARIRRLALCLSSDAEFAMYILELFEYLPMDNLEIFELHLREGSEEDPDEEEFETAFSFKGRAPRLKAVRTVSRFMRIFHAGTALAQSNITDFQLDASRRFMLEWDEFPSLFANAATLTTLSLSGKIFTGRSPFDIETISLPSLKYFRCRDDVVARSIAHFLRAPLLEQLVLQNLNIGAWAKASRRDAPRVNAFPRIKVVAFMNCDIYKNSNPLFTALAQATCSATHIMVSHDNILKLSDNGGMIGHLVQHGRKPMLWEHLEVLSCFDQYMSRERYKCYLDMMNYRVENVLNGKAGKLRIIERLAKQNLGSAANEGVVEVVRYGEDVLPWPDKDLFHRSGEEFFLLG